MPGHEGMVDYCMKIVGEGVTSLKTQVTLQLIPTEYIPRVMANVHIVGLQHIKPTLLPKSLSQKDWQGSISLFNKRTGTSAFF